MMDEYRIKTFVRRLNKLGIDVTFAANYPWIYFDTINGKEVTGTFHADHGWTAFFSPIDVHGKVKFSDRREVFKKVREYIKVIEDPVKKPFPHNILRTEKQAFTFWYEKCYLQSPRLCALQYDDEKLWEAWKVAYNMGLAKGTNLDHIR